MSVERNKVQNNCCWKVQRSATVVWRTRDRSLTNIIRKYYLTTTTTTTMKAFATTDLKNSACSTTVACLPALSTTHKSPLQITKFPLGTTLDWLKELLNKDLINTRLHSDTENTLNSTELSKYIWQLKDNSVNFNIKWSIIARARPYNNTTKRCDLCLTEKLMIIKFSSNNLLNKRSKLISKCRHENKFYLKNIWRFHATIDFCQYIHTYCLIVLH